MMRRILAWLLVLAFLCTGCGQSEKTLEEMAITLTAAMDLAENGDLIFYQNNPVFTQSAQGKSNTLMVKADTVRQARGKMQMMSTGTIRGGKLQVLLIGKGFLQSKSALPYVDSFLRDAKNPSNVTLAVVDVPIGEIMTYRPKEQHLGLYLHELISTAQREGSTVKTLLREYRDQSFEPGMTTVVSEMTKKGNMLTITGAALLDRKGHYVASLNREETSLLLFLQDEVQQTISCTLTKQKASINLGLTKYKVKTSFADGKFQFKIKLKVSVELTELVETELLHRDGKKLEKMITEEVQGKLQKLADKLQKNKVDPIGLGLHARAFEYDHWKKVEQDWPDAFSKAKIEVQPEITIQNYGVIK